jgi:hypothetical protein
MDNWLAVLRAVGGILSAAAATATLINTFACVRRDDGGKAKSSKSHLPGVSFRGPLARVGRGRRTRTKRI